MSRPSSSPTVLHDLTRCFFSFPKTPQTMSLRRPFKRKRDPTLQHEHPCTSRRHHQRSTTTKPARTIATTTTTFIPHDVWSMLLAVVWEYVGTDFGPAVASWTQQEKERVVQVVQHWTAGIRLMVEPPVYDDSCPRVKNYDDYLFAPPLVPSDVLASVTPSSSASSSSSLASQHQKSQTPQTPRTPETSLEQETQTQRKDIVLPLHVRLWAVQSSLLSNRRIVAWEHVFNLVWDMGLVHPIDLVSADRARYDLLPTNWSSVLSHHHHKPSYAMGYSWWTADESRFPTWWLEQHLSVGDFCALPGWDRQRCLCRRQFQAPFLTNMLRHIWAEHKQEQKRRQRRDPNYVPSYLRPNDPPFLCRLISNLIATQAVVRADSYALVSTWLSQGWIRPRHIPRLDGQRLFGPLHDEVAFSNVTLDDEDGTIHPDPDPDPSDRDKSNDRMIVDPHWPEHGFALIRSDVARGPRFHPCATPCATAISVDSVTTTDSTTNDSRAISEWFCELSLLARQATVDMPETIESLLTSFIHALLPWAERSCPLTEELQKHYAFDWHAWLILVPARFWDTCPTLGKHLVPILLHPVAMRPAPVRPLSDPICQWLAKHYIDHRLSAEFEPFVNEEGFMEDRPNHWRLLCHVACGSFLIDQLRAGTFVPNVADWSLWITRRPDLSISFFESFTPSIGSHMGLVSAILERDDLLVDSIVRPRFHHLVHSLLSSSSFHLLHKP